MASQDVGRGRHRLCVFQAPADARNVARSRFDEIRRGGHQVVEVVDDRDILVFSQKSILSRRYVAVAPDVGKGKILVPSHRMHFAVGHLEACDHTAREKRGKKRPDANLAKLDVR